MAQFQVTFFFEGVQLADNYASANVGWTETWYTNNEVASLDAALTLPAVDAYIGLRRAILADVYRCVWVRASDVANPRSSKVRAILGGKGTINTQGNLKNAAAQVTCALLVDIVRRPRAALPLTEPAHHRRFLLRALPATVIAGNVINTSGAKWAAVKQFLDYIGDHETGGAHGGPAAAWMMRYYDPTNNAGFPITTWIPVAGAPKTISLTAVGFGPLTLNDQVRIQGAVYPRGINRKWRALAAAVASGPFLLGTSRFNIEGPWDGTGKIYPVKYAYNLPDQYTIIGLRTRKIGRPFRLTRGRRRNS